MIKLTKEEYLERIKTKQSVSRFEFELDFEFKTIQKEFIEIIKSIYADLRYADLHCANLSSANLSSADLRYADLRYADLRYADLSYADLRYADLRYADLRCATGTFIFNFGVRLEVKK